MAQVTNLRDDSTPFINSAVQHVQKKITVSATPLADNIEVFGVPLSQKWRLVRAVMRVAGTLGAGATLTLQVNKAGVRTVLTPASTAAAASIVSSDADIDAPVDVDGGNVVELLVGGAAISASASVTVDLLYSNRI